MQPLEAAGLPSRTNVAAVHSANGRHSRAALCKSPTARTSVATCTTRAPGRCPPAARLFPSRALRSARTPPAAPRRRSETARSTLRGSRRPSEWWAFVGSASRTSRRAPARQRTGEPFDLCAVPALATAEIRSVPINGRIHTRIGVDTHSYKYNDR